MANTFSKVGIPGSQPMSTFLGSHHVEDEEHGELRFLGNSSRGYALASRGGLTLKKSDSDRNTVGAGGDSVFSLFSVSSVVACF